MRNEHDDKQIWKRLANRLDDAYQCQDAKKFVQKLVDISREFNDEDIMNCLEGLVPASYVYEKIKETSDFKELSKLVGCISDWNYEWFMERKTLEGTYLSSVTNADIISFTYKLEMLADRGED